MRWLSSQLPLLLQGNVTAYVTGFSLDAYPLRMLEEVNETAQYVAELNTNVLLPDLAYSNQATLSFCDSVRHSAGQ